MNKEFLVDHVFKSVKPLAYDRILETSEYLHIVATNVFTGNGVIFNSFSNPSKLFDVLRATICLPMIAGRHSLVDGEPYIDGGLSQQIAVQSAIDAGATHIIVLMTRTRGAQEREIKEGFQIDATGLRIFYGKHIETLYRARNQKINMLLESITCGYVNTKNGMVRIDAISRSTDCVEVGRLTKDGSALKQAYVDGRAASADYLDSVTSNLNRI